MLEHHPVDQKKTAGGMARLSTVSDLLCVALEDIDRVDGRVSEVPQPEGGVSGGRDHQTLGGVGAAVGQLLIMS